MWRVPGLNTKDTEERGQVCDDLELMITFMKISYTNPSMLPWF